MIPWWLLSVALADPVGPEEPSVAEPAPASEPPAEMDPNTAPFGEAARRAEQWYFEGKVEEARRWLEVLQLRVLAGEPDLDREQIVEALTYLGEIQYAAGEQDTARMTFRWLLEGDVDTPISPYHHPLEVVNLFELVRATVKAERVDPVALPPPPPSPTPPWVLLPLGVPQFVQHRTAAGALYGGAQLALATTSMVTWFQLAQYTGTPTSGLPEDERFDRQLKRYAIQWPATFGFYGLWAASSIDASRWHHRHPPVVLGPALGPQPGIVVSGRF